MYSNPLPLRSLLLLRFTPELEQEFRSAYQQNGLFARWVLMWIGIILIGASPLYDGWLLEAPEAFRDLAHALQFGVMIPTLLLGMLWLRLSPQHPALSHWMIFIAVVVSGGLILQRHWGHSMGFEVPREFFALPLFTTFLFGRVLLYQFTPWVVLCTVLDSYAELHLMQFSSASIYGVIAIWMTISIAIVTAYLLEYSARESWYRGRLLEMQALHDSLTHLPNRRYFDIHITALLRKSSRDKKNVVLMMIDLDFFKNYNDFYGHPMGDECLKQVAGALNQRPRRTQDFMARLGGEEFVAVWFDVKPEHVISLGEQLLEQVRALELPHEKSEFGKVTASAGIRVLVSEHPDTDALILLKEADLALYEAKKAGRNQLQLFNPYHAIVT